MIDINIMQDMVELIASEAKRLESELSSLAAAIEAQKKKDQPDIQVIQEYSISK